MEPYQIFLIVLGVLTVVAVIVGIVFMTRKGIVTAYTMANYKGIAHPFNESNPSIDVAIRSIKYPDDMIVLLYNEPDFKGSYLNPLSNRYSLFPSDLNVTASVKSIQMFKKTDFNVTLYSGLDGTGDTTMQIQNSTPNINPPLLVSSVKCQQNMEIMLQLFSGENYTGNTKLLQLAPDRPNVDDPPFITASVLLIYPGNIDNIVPQTDGAIPSVPVSYNSTTYVTLYDGIGYTGYINQITYVGYFPNKFMGGGSVQSLDIASGVSIIAWSMNKPAYTLTGRIPNLLEYIANTLNTTFVTIPPIDFFEVKA